MRKIAYNKDPLYKEHALFPSRSHSLWHRVHKVTSLISMRLYGYVAPECTQGDQVQQPLCNLYLLCIYINMNTRGLAVCISI